MRFKIKSLLSDSCSGKFFNTSNDSLPTTHNELVGGNHQEWSKEFQNRGFLNKNKKSLTLIDILRTSPDGEGQRHQGFQHSPKGWGIGGLL